MFEFTCNLCNSRCAVETKETIDREIPSCHRCGSTQRFRWIVHAISEELFGRSIPLPFFPKTKNVKALGMSDWSRLANALGKKFDYVNTFYDTTPKFDILNPEPRQERLYDFVIASEVFEHIPPPVQPAFDNLARILRPDGFAVFSVPWAPDGHTREHFPELHDWKLVKVNGAYRLTNRTADGRLQTFDDLVFHGGPGFTLEMRLYSRDDLLTHFRTAGFEQVEISTPDENLEFGIVGKPWSLGMVARKSEAGRVKIPA